MNIKELCELKNIYDNMHSLINASAMQFSYQELYKIGMKPQAIIKYRNLHPNMALVDAKNAIEDEMNNRPLA